MGKLTPTETIMLADDLSLYINKNHTKEKCDGFVDGYKSALKKLKNLRESNKFYCNDEVHYPSIGRCEKECEMCKEERLK